MTVVVQHQSLVMIRAMKIVTALAVCLAVANATGPFPRDRELVYSYYGDVKAGIIEPAAYASQYSISGKLNILPIDDDLEYPNSFIAALVNVKTGLHNGIAEHYEPTKASRSLPEPAQVLEEPFLIAYRENGQLAGVRISSEEPGWSKNMKMAMASMLQLDIPSMNLQAPIKHHSFMSKENTIHGDCWTSYDVHPSESADELIITKFGSPRNCTNYNIFTFNNAEVEDCDLPPERPVNMASRRVFKVKKDHQDILIKSLVAHGGVNYFPWKGRSEAHYVLNNATFVLLEGESPAVNLKAGALTDTPAIVDISYQRPERSYSQGSGIDVTQGRHVVADANTLISKSKEMLREAAAYLEENHLEGKEPDFKHGQTINRLVQTMSFMETPALRRLFSDVKSTDGAMKTIFLETLPHVGTDAAIEVINELIRLEETDVDRIFAIQMLAKLPLSIRNPTPETALLLSPFTTDGLSYNVRAAAIPSFGSLLFRAFKNIPKPEEHTILKEQIEVFHDQLVNSEYNEKVAALAGLRNLQAEGTFHRLAPLIRGEMELKRFPDASLTTNLRMHAIWAVEKSIPSYQAAHDLLWPIMADSNLPLKLRIAAYDVLIRQAPSMTNILHIYWFMVYEKNEHLYNYHHTTIKGLANSVNPCDMHLKELATKILRFTRIHTPVSYSLSSSFMVNAMDAIYGHGDQVSVSYTLNEDTGFPDVLNIESSEIAGRKRVALWKIQLILGNFNHYTSPVTAFLRFGRVPVTDNDVFRILEETSTSLNMGELLIDAVVSFKGRVVFANHYNGRTVIRGLLDDFAPLVRIQRNTAKIVRQFVSYDAMYEQHVVSEMGLPVLLESKIPMVQSIAAVDQRDYTLGSMKELGYRAWRHGDYSMSIYNPLLDVWHSIRRATATDVQFFYEFTEGRSFMPAVSETTIPILSGSKPFRQGFITHAKDCTTISEDDDGALKKSCPTCEYHETVTKGISAKRNHEDVYDVKDTGLEYSTSVFDCETGLTPLVIDKDFFRSLFKERKNSWGYDWSAELLALSQTFKNLIISPRMGSCGFMHKIEPSTKYPTSHLKLGLKVNVENVDDNQKTPHILSATKFSLRGNMKAINENETTCTWHVNMDLDMSREHKQNTMSLQVSRLTPGEKNLVICVDAQKTYPSLPHDPLKLGVTKDETYSKLTVALGKTDTTDCPSDQTLITIGVKGELSEEQRRKFIQESISGDCKADMDKPMYKNSEGLIPRTEKCLDHAIRFTTLRKYTINVTHDNVPQCIASALQSYEDEIKALLYPHLVYTSEHTEEGTMRMTIKFPMNLESINMSVATSDQGWDIVGAEVSDQAWLGMERDPPRHQGFGPDPDKHLWISPLDNSRFPLGFITNYKSNTIRLCSLYPEVVLTTDGGEISHSMSDKWTLATGDSFSQSFAVFVKSVNNVMGLKMFLGANVVEFSPKRNDYSITINDEDFAVNELINGTIVPRDQLPWTFKLSNYGEINAVQMNDIPLTIFYSLNSVTILIDRKLQGNIAGLCGNLNGKYKYKLPEIYQIP